MSPSESERTRRRASSYPRADRPFSPEGYGIEPVRPEDRHGRASELGLVWFAANLGVVGVVYGAVVAALGLDLVQALVVVTVATTASFLVVGALGVAGKEYGEATLVVSRRVFGAQGNLGPALASWASLLGWEALTAGVAAGVLAGPLRGILGTGRTPALALALVLVAGASLLLGRLGHATVVVVARVVTVVFGLGTFALVGWLLASPGLSVNAAPARAGAVAAAAGFVAASAGLSWVNVSADYARYLPRATSGRAVAAWTVLGGSVPVGVLAMVGDLVARRLPGLAGSGDPVGALGRLLPAGWGVPYLLVALAGLVVQVVMGLYSSGLGLLVLGVRARRTRTVFVDAVVMVVLGAAILWSPRRFLGDLVGLVELLACPLVAWAAVVLARWPASRRATSTTSVPEPPTRAFVTAAVLPWGAGSAVGLLTTSTAVFHGPLATGPFAAGGPGYLAGGLFAAVLAGGERLVSARRRALPAAREDALVRAPAASGGPRPRA